MRLDHDFFWVHNSSKRKVAEAKRKKETSEDEELGLNEDEELGLNEDEDLTVNFYSVIFLAYKKSSLFYPL